VGCQPAAEPRCARGAPTLRTGDRASAGRMRAKARPSTGASWPKAA
jgi:hypothetical protein